MRDIVPMRQTKSIKVVNLVDNPMNPRRTFAARPSREMDLRSRCIADEMTSLFISTLCRCDSHVFISANSHFVIAIIGLVGFWFPFINPYSLIVRSDCNRDVVLGKNTRYESDHHPGGFHMQRRPFTHCCQMPCSHLNGTSPFP